MINKFFFFFFGNAVLKLQILFRGLKVSNTNVTLILAYWTELKERVLGGHTTQRYYDAVIKRSESLVVVCKKSAHNLSDREPHGISHVNAALSRKSTDRQYDTILPVSQCTDQIVIDVTCPVAFDCVTSQTSEPSFGSWCGRSPQISIHCSSAISIKTSEHTDLKWPFILEFRQSFISWSCLWRNLAPNVSFLSLTACDSFVIITRMRIECSGLKSLIHFLALRRTGSVLQRKLRIMF